MVVLQPSQKDAPAVKILPNLAGLRTDQQYDEFLQRNKNEKVRIIKF